MQRKFEQNKKNIKLLTTIFTSKMLKLKYKPLEFQINRMIYKETLLQATRTP